MKDAYSYMKILGSEDSSLNPIYNEELKEIQISIMGKIQLEILKEVILERFNLKVDFGPCEILYKESIKESAIGVGHFEPLKHYAEVVLKIEPNKRNSGITFESLAHVDDISIGHQNLIKTHIFERKHRGILGGFELTDLKITLLTGRAHIKHTEGGDFREATFRALRQGLEEVENILLEPYYKFKIEIENDYIGRVISDIQKMSGSFEIKQSNFCINIDTITPRISDSRKEIPRMIKSAALIASALYTPCSSIKRSAASDASPMTFSIASAGNLSMSFASSSLSVNVVTPLPSSFSNCRSVFSRMFSSQCSTTFS